ncbi:MAG: SRPBCC family protein, partial [Pseudomonadota bacterium]
MAKALKQHEQVDAAFLAADSTPPHVRQRLAVPAKLAWAALLDAKAWSQWLPIESVTWDSPEPLGVGTQRTVVAGGQTIEETFY